MKDSTSNLPPNLTEEFNNEKVKTKVCDWCRGERGVLIADGIGIEIKWIYIKCPICKGSGQVELTSEEIEAIEEEKREKQSGIYNQ